MDNINNQNHTKRNNNKGLASAPISLKGFFGNDSSSDSDNDESSINDAASTAVAFEQVYETQEIMLCKTGMKIRQFSWHKANANQVWPGTFRLAEYIDENRKHYYTDGDILELGAATGALTIFLLKNTTQRHYNIITSDIKDDGEVEINIKFNLMLNCIDSSYHKHVPYTWNDGKFPTINHKIKYIVASDILLYVSAYPDLIITLNDVFSIYDIEEFIMSWQRRIAESKIFFEMLIDNGYTCDAVENWSGLYVIKRK